MPVSKKPVKRSHAGSDQVASQSSDKALSRENHSRQRKNPTASVPRATIPVVGIGASAGGLKAFEALFTHMPPDSGMAFILVQHLNPDQKSMLAEILRRFTS